MDNLSKSNQSLDESQAGSLTALTVEKVSNCTQEEFIWELFNELDLESKKIFVLKAYSAIIEEQNK